MADKGSAFEGARIVGERYVRAKRQENPDGRMPLMDHLRELRNRRAQGRDHRDRVGMGIALYYSNPTIQWVIAAVLPATINGHSGCHTSATRSSSTAFSTRSTSASRSPSSSR